MCAQRIYRPAQGDQFSSVAVQLANQPRFLYLRYLSNLIRCAGLSESLLDPCSTVLFQRQCSNNLLRFQPKFVVFVKACETLETYSFSLQCINKLLLRNTMESRHEKMCLRAQAASLCLPWYPRCSYQASADPWHSTELRMQSLMRLGRCIGGAVFARRTCPKTLLLMARFRKIRYLNGRFIVVHSISRH